MSGEEGHRSQVTGSDDAAAAPAESPAWGSRGDFDAMRSRMDAAASKAAPDRLIMHPETYEEIGELAGMPVRDPRARLRAMLDLNPQTAVKIGTALLAAYAPEASSPAKPKPSASSPQPSALEPDQRPTQPGQATTGARSLLYRWLACVPHWIAPSLREETDAYLEANPVNFITPDAGAVRSEPEPPLRSTHAESIEWLLDRFVESHPTTQRHAVTALELAVWLDQQRGKVRQ